MNGPSQTSQSISNPDNVPLQIYSYVFIYLMCVLTQHILNMHGGSSSVPRMPQETRDFGLVSKFIRRVIAARQLRWSL